MTKEEMRIAIATACGWVETPSAWSVKSSSRYFSKGGKEVHEDSLPDYTSDLNAMHEAEKVLTDAQWITYIMHLHNDVIIYPTKRAVCATAAQRAEAFLKTIGKWKEPPQSSIKTGEGER